MHPVIQNKASRLGGQIARSILYLIVLVFALGLGWFITPAAVHYRLTERYVFSSPQHLAAVSLAVILPKNGAYQTVENMRIAWDGAQEQVSHPALEVLNFQGAIQSGETRAAAISYDVILNQGAARWSAPVQDFQLLPQPEIESDQANLVQQAARITSGQTRKDAYALYTFTSDYLSWPQGTRTGGNQSALSAYTTRVGGCGEFANLAAALYRAAHIPAQSITGLALPAYPPFWSDTQTWNHPGGAHAWVEVYSESGWELADPSWGSAWPMPLKWLWFGRSDGSHLSYGESGQYAQLYDELLTWGKQNGTLLGAMSNPLHFVSAASAEGVNLTPSVTLQKRWDGRWVATLVVYLLLLVGIRRFERYLKRPK